MEIGEGTDRILKSELLIKPDGIKWAFHYIILYSYPHLKLFRLRVRPTLTA